MCRVRGSEEESPGLHWKSLLCNLNIVSVVFTSPPTVLPRWNSLRRVFNTLSRWGALGPVLMGADWCLLPGVPTATQHVRHGGWCHEWTLLSHEPKERQHQLLFLYIPQPSLSNSCLPEEELRRHFLKKLMHSYILLRKLWFCQNNFSSRKGLISKPLLVWKPELWGETMVILSSFGITSRKM